jgi:hypothetical protein
MNAGLACVSEFQTRGFGLVRCMQMECPRDANFVLHIRRLLRRLVLIRRRQ